MKTSFFLSTLKNILWSVVPYFQWVIIAVSESTVSMSHCGSLAVSVAVSNSVSKGHRIRSWLVM
jgi:hypothetical protein